MSNTTPVTNAAFKPDVLESDVPVIVDFWAEWCAPCKLIAPHLDTIATEYSGRAKVVKVDIEAEQELAEKYNITSIPTLLFFNKGEVVAQLIGARPKVEIATKLEALL